MQHLNNGFNKFKLDYSTYVKMLMVQKMWKTSLNHSSIIAKHWVACVSIYFNKCKIQLVNNGFKILKVNGSIHVHVDNWKYVKKINDLF